MLCNINVTATLTDSMNPRNRPGIVKPDTTTMKMNRPLTSSEHLAS